MWRSIANSWLVDQGDFDSRKSAVSFMDTVLSHGLIVQITPGGTGFQDTVTLYRFKQDEASASSHLQQSQGSRVSVSIEAVVVRHEESKYLFNPNSQALDVTYATGELAAAIRADEPEKVASLVFNNEDKPSSEEEIVFLFHKCVAVRDTMTTIV